MSEPYVPYYCDTTDRAQQASKMLDEHFRVADLSKLVGEYLSEEDTHRIYDAFLFAADAHDGVTRKSGEAYIFHPLTVAHILAEMHMDADTICAALLHDVIEDTEHTKKEIVRLFGQVTADLVDGVTKLAGGEFTDRESAAAASFHKMMTAMIQDFRVVLIKLADRQHNIKTLGAMPRHKQRRIARETLNIHVPLARRMGMNAMRTDLQLTAFQHLHPWRFKALKNAIDAYSKKHHDAHQKIRDEIQAALAANDIQAELPLWKKNLYRLYQRVKSRKGKKYISQQSEPLDIRIIVDSKMDCYRVLGTIHSLYRPKIGTFRDFIAIPKVYGFQAIETSVSTRGHQLIRVLIQSRQMHYIAQYGITAHWRFPEMEESVQDLQNHLDRWLMQVEDIQKTQSTAAEFLEDIKADLFLNEIYISTPKGDTKILPSGATPIDFAYAIHSEVGHHCIGAYVDDQRVSLNSRLFNGATVKILTDKIARPQPSWLNSVVSGKARSAIRYWLRKTKAENFKEMGQQLLSKTLKHYHHLLLEEITAKQWQKTLDILLLDDKASLFSEIAKGNQNPKLISCRLAGVEVRLIASEEPDQPLLIKSTEGLAVKLQSCCHPIPGDTLVALLNEEVGLAVHRVACPTLTQDSENTFSLAWAEETEEQTFLAPLKIFANNHYGVLFKITNLLNRMEVNVEDLTITGDSEVKEMYFLLQVEDTRRLQEIIGNLNNVSDIIRVARAF
ncbi:MAG TPA: bifunctional (p)ppGpp synthetase/guanosine-3',5'-bis(diphosphate) 3'-pyrophosphohydrolase [Leucothrix mucor]|nr:bifunctional (p)ppGpp synthetase/guanosine-3',5'-bis(diphosphate) 3'-pyrophosphohydrolase [Leucothrix mucor]